MEKAIYVDWLSIQYLGEPQKVHPWEWKLLPYSCKEFKELYDVYYKGEMFGRYSYIPSLPNLPQDLGILKVENKHLYLESLQQILKELTWDCKLTYKGLSRVDICADFNTFENGRNPENLIRNYMSGKWDCLNKMSCQCARGPKGDSPYESLTFGSRSSDVRVYLYNKTKEMNDKTFKTWIMESDILHGIDWKKPVWRLEVSLKGEAKKWYSKETGEYIEIQLNNLFDAQWLNNFFNSMRGKYFRFIEHSTNTNRYRQEEIKIWDESFQPIHRLRTREHEDVNRADRIFAKKMIEEIKARRPHDPQNTPAIALWAYNWLDDHRLTDYVKKRTSIPTW